VTRGSCQHAGGWCLDSRLMKPTSHRRIPSTTTNKKKTRGACAGEVGGSMFNALPSNPTPVAPPGQRHGRDRDRRCALTTPIQLPGGGVGLRAAYPRPRCRRIRTASRQPCVLILSPVFRFILYFWFLFYCAYLGVSRFSFLGIYHKRHRDQ
jgi:hypothetical protein